MKKLFLSLVCMFALLATTSCGEKASTPADAATECLELVKAQNYEAFVETIKMSDKVTAEEIEQTKQMYVALFKEKAEKEITKKGGIASYTLVKEEIAEDGQTAKVEFDVTYGNGTTKKQKFDMILVDGKWMQNANK